MMRSTPGRTADQSTAFMSGGGDCPKRLPGPRSPSRPTIAPPPPAPPPHPPRAPQPLQLVDGGCQTLALQRDVVLHAHDVRVIGRIVAHAFVPQPLTVLFAGAR